MSPVDLLTELSTVGVVVAFAGDNLDVEGPTEAVTAYLPLIRRHKPALLGLLDRKRQHANNDSSVLPNDPPDELPVEWHLFWDERAAIMEYEGRLPRERGEALALIEVLAGMKKLNLAT